MTTFVEAVQVRLASDVSVQAVLGSSDIYPTWVFQDRPYAPVEGSQRVAVVLSWAGSWTTPNTHNTMKFPRLRVEFLGDPTRGETGQTRVQDARNKIALAHEAVDKVLHRVDGSDVIWSGVRILRSSRLGELDLSWEPETDGMVRAEVYYGLGLG